MSDCLHIFACHSAIIVSPNCSPQSSDGRTGLVCKFTRRQDSKCGSNWCKYAWAERTFSYTLWYAVYWGFPKALNAHLTWEVLHSHEQIFTENLILCSKVCKSVHDNTNIQLTSATSCSKLVKWEQCFCESADPQNHFHSANWQEFQKVLQNSPIDLVSFQFILLLSLSFLLLCALI